MKPSSWLVKMKASSREFPINKAEPHMFIFVHSHQFKYSFIKVLCTRKFSVNTPLPPSNKITLRFCYLGVGRLRATIGFEAMAVNPRCQESCYLYPCGWSFGSFPIGKYVRYIFQEKNPPSIKN